VSEPLVIFRAPDPYLIILLFIIVSVSYWTGIFLGKALGRLIQRGFTTARRRRRLTRPSAPA
jgi:hypothetical protein